MLIFHKVLHKPLAHFFFGKSHCFVASLNRWVKGPFITSIRRQYLYCSGRLVHLSSNSQPIMRQTLQIHITLLNKMIYVSLLHCFISYGSLVNLRWISTSFYLTHNNFQRTWDWCRTRVWNEQNRIFFQNFRRVNISRFSIKHMLPCLICKTLSDFCTVGVYPMSYTCKFI
jgi:hypothetical protein